MALRSLWVGELCSQGCSNLVCTLHMERGRSKSFSRSHVKFQGQKIFIKILALGSVRARTMQSVCSLCTLHVKVEEVNQISRSNNFGSWDLVCLTSEINKPQ